MKLLIIAAPHSGTRYIAKVLQAKGLDIPHESHVGEHGLVSWHYGVETGHDPMLGHSSTDHRKNFDFILHQVRHPISFLRSAMIISRPQWEYIFAQRLFKPPPVPKFYASLDNLGTVLPVAMRFWLAWNENCEQLSDYTYRVEAVKFTDVSQKTHSLEGNPRYAQDLWWGELDAANLLLANTVRDVAAHYGYGGWT